MMIIKFYLQNFTISFLFLLLLSFIPIPLFYANAYSYAYSPQTVHPLPRENLSSIENQLKRFEGQTKFLNPLPRIYRVLEASSAERRSDSAEKNERSIEESDIFKIGKKGEKILFLLNNYRGLQTVSFHQGPQNPQLLSHSGATGFFPQDMYYDEPHDRLLVLESIWNWRHQNRSHMSRRDDGTIQPIQHTGRIIVYDVSNPHQIKTDQIINLSGPITDSRKVGEVLYIATENNNIGTISSFSLAHQEIQMAGNYQLSSPLERQDLMNIVSIKKGDSHFYYLLAALRDQQSTNLWLSQNQSIAVIDISDPKGHIRPMMEVSIRGTIRERSQMMIKDNSLISVSNYFPPEDSEGINQRNLRISVESFPLGGHSPLTSSRILEKEEADYRLFLLNKAIKEKREELRGLNFTLEQIETTVLAYREKLITGKILYQGRTLILKNLFVHHHTQKEMLSPIVATTTLSVGSTENLHASIQDVRITPSKLYVFWVPQNMIDPLDVFDISQVDQTMTYQGRLIFDGWIERAIPLTFKGNDYIVGLGHLRTNLNNENSRSYPQAILFKIEDNGRRKTIISQITLKSPHTWVNFNSPDKMIEFRFDPETGQGAIMFQVHHYHRHQSRNGGKLLGFDLTKEEQVFTEGGLLLSHSHSWLRRVFSNPEIEMIHTFSDRELATFPVQLSSAHLHNQIYSSISVLELARNVRGYFTLTHKGTQRGVQIVSKEDPTQGQAEIELRFVSAHKADSEKNQSLHMKTLPGYFVNWMKISEEVALIQTESFTQIPGSHHYQTTIFLSLVSLHSPDSLTSPVIQTQEITLPSDPPAVPYQPAFSFQNRKSLIQLPSSKIFLIKDAHLFHVPVMMSPQPLLLAPTPMTLNNCEQIMKKNSPTLQLIDEKFLIMTAHDYIAEEGSNPRPDFHFQYQRNFMNQLTFNDTSHPFSFQCGSSINIPGIPLKIIGDDSHLPPGEQQQQQQQIITSDQVQLGRSVIRPHLTALTLMLPTTTPTHNNNATATLSDTMSAKNLNINAIKSFGLKKLVYFESYQSVPFYGYYPHLSFPRPIYPMSNQSSLLTYLGLNSQGRFERETFDHLFSSSSISELPEILKIGRITPKKNDYFFLIKSGKKVSVLKVDPDSLLPQTVPLRSPHSSRHDLEFIEVINPYGLWDTENVIHYNSQLKSFEISEGDFGVTQFFLKKN